MKLNKIFAIALAALTMTACSDDEAGINSASGVTVSFEQAMLTVNEADGLVRVPVVVSGNTNGVVSMNITVAENGSSPATADENYLLSDKHLTIGPGESVGYVEFLVVNDRFLNDDRKFTITISSVDGATKGQLTSCLVTIADNDATLYGRLQGDWTMNAFDPFEDGEVAVKCKTTITGLKEGDIGFGETLFINFNQSGTDYTVQASLGVASDGVTPVLKVALGQAMISGYNYSDTYTLDILLRALDLATGSAYSSGTISIGINEDESQLIWPARYALMGYAMALSPDGGYLGGLGWWTGFYNVTWDRK